jgi:quinol monooxygenase YgiN
MIIRLVQLTISTSQIEQFLELFEASKERIRSSPGCLELTLLQDVQDPQRISTLSKWESEDALNAYRSTDFFRETWAASKAMFSDRAKAVSYRAISGT